MHGCVLDLLTESLLSSRSDFVCHFLPFPQPVSFSLLWFAKHACRKTTPCFQRENDLDFYISFELSLYIIDSDFALICFYFINSSIFQT